MIRCSRVISAHRKSDRDGFVDAFKEAFGGAPYFESYTDQEVISDIWLPHLENGSIILAHDDERSSNTVVGFGCAMPLSKAPDDVREFLYQEEGSLPSDFDPAKTWYMSELGVLEEYRERGLAYELVRHRLISINHGGGTHYVMRTAADGSNSRHLYERIGSSILTHEQDVSSSKQVVVQGCKSTKRVYLYGTSSDALTFIAGRSSSVTN